MYFPPRFEISFVSNSYRKILHIRFSNTFSYQLERTSLMDVMSSLSFLQISLCGVAVLSKVT